MYAHDVAGRAGLEIIWLKLSLLAEIIGIARTTRVDLSRCKIKLGSAVHLPRLWNFSIEFFPAADTTIQAVLQEAGLHWFRTMLVSPRHTAAEVDSVVAPLLTASDGDVHALFESAMYSPAMQSKAVPADLWKRILHVGLKLATRIPNFSYLSQASDTREAALGRALIDVEALRAQFQAALFIDPPRMEQDLAELLNELIDDPGWLNSLGGVSATRAVARQETIVVVEPPEEENNMESTIIIKRGASPSASASIKPAVVSPPQAQPPAAPAEENLEATIIISKDRKR